MYLVYNSNSNFCADNPGNFGHNGLFDFKNCLILPSFSNF